jgi:hypothetical protein
MTIRTLGLTVVLLSAVATAPASPAFAQKKPKPAKPGQGQPYAIPGPVSISAKPNPTVFSTPVTITGRVEKAAQGTVVTLAARILPATGFTTVATGRVAKNGTYTFSHRPPRNTYYRVSAALQPVVSSGDLLVKVQTLIGFRVSDSTPARGSRVRFSGIVRPRHDGRTAYIQKQASGGRWVTVGRATLRKLDANSSRYRKTLRVRRSGQYRVRVLGHADHAMGISRTRTITVR